MTFEPTFIDKSTGAGILGLLVTINNEISGRTSSRSTDGNGYANVALPANTSADDRMTVSFVDPQLRYKGDVWGDAYTAKQLDKTETIALVPFV